MYDTQNKSIVEYVTIKDFPETKSIPTRNENGDGTYKFDVLKATKIPTRPDAHKNSIKDVEFKFSSNNNTPGILVSALDVTKMIAQNHEKLKDGRMYARVTLFMSARANRDGVVDSYSPYINNVEFIETTEVTKGLIDAAIGGNKDPQF